MATVGLIRRYVVALREEPKMRAYVAAALIDDLGVAVSFWIWQLTLAQLFVDQRARASLMMPALLCFIAGSVLAGPLADWPSTGRTRLPLGMWRWRTVLVGRAIEILALAALVVGLMQGQPTIGRIMPYFLLSAFMKTALRPARIALEVDLLQHGTTRLDAGGGPMYDEHGHPIIYKEHLLSFASLITVANAVATLGGLLLGSHVQTALRGRIWIVFAFDIFTSIVFCGVVWARCRPAPGMEDPPVAVETAAARISFGRFALSQFFGALRQGVRYLGERQQRPLLWLLFGGLLIEVVSEFYDGKMVVKHILNGSDDQLRRAQIIWSSLSILAVVALPALAERLRFLGRIFLVIMVVDGAIIVLAGNAAARAVPAGVVPFALWLGLDHALTQASSTLMGVAQNSTSNAAMRGRIAATYAFVVLLMDVVAEGVATAAADAVGIPAMIRDLGVVQIGLMLVVAVIGGRSLWNYGMTTVSADPVRPVVAGVPGAAVTKDGTLSPKRIA